MQIIKQIFILGLPLVINSCDKKFEDNTNDKAVLLFKSGFEGGVYIENEPHEDYLDVKSIEGTDSETGFTWSINILGASFSGLHYVDDDNFQALESEIQEVIGHDGSMTKTLYNIEHYNTDNTFF